MLLNSRQKRILVIGVALITLMGLFPPWTYTFKLEGRYSEEPAGLQLIALATSTKYESTAAGVTLDVSKLLVQWGVVSLGPGLALMLTSDHSRA